MRKIFVLIFLIGFIIASNEHKVVSRQHSLLENREDLTSVQTLEGSISICPTNKEAQTDGNIENGYDTVKKQQTDLLWLIILILFLILLLLITMTTMIVLILKKTLLRTN